MKNSLVISRATIQEIVNKKTFLITIFIALLFMIITPALGVLSTRQEHTTLTSITLGIIQITAIILSIILPSTSLPNEIEQKTIYLIISKPVSRTQFFLGKFIGIWATISLVIALMSSILFLLPILWQKELWIKSIPLMSQGVCMYIAQASLLTCLSFFFSTFLSPVLNFFLSGGIYFLGSIMNPLITSLERDHTPKILKMLFTVIQACMPNFSHYNIQNSIIHPEHQLVNPTLYWVSSVSYTIVYMSILLILGKIIFDRREL